MIYQELLDALQQLTPEQLQMDAQVVKCSFVNEQVNEGLPVVAVDTVDNFGILHIRSCKDNRRHGDEVYLLLDGNDHAEDGATSYLIGDNFEDTTPCYPKTHDDAADWTGPAQKLLSKTVKELPDGTQGPILSHRMGNL